MINLIMSILYTLDGGLSRDLLINFAFFVQAVTVDNGAGYQYRKIFLKNFPKNLDNPIFI